MRQSEPSQRGRADDAAGPAGAIYNDRRILPPRQLVRPKDQITARHIDGAGNAEPAELLRCTHVEHQ